MIEIKSVTSVGNQVGNIITHVSFDDNATVFTVVSGLVKILELEGYNSKDIDNLVRRYINQ